MTKTESPCCAARSAVARSEEHTSELQSLRHLVCRLLLEKKKKTNGSPAASNRTVLLLVFKIVILSITLALLLTISAETMAKRSVLCRPARDMALYTKHSA